MSNAVQINDNNAYKDWDRRNSNFSSAFTFGIPKTIHFLDILSQDLQVTGGECACMDHKYSVLSSQCLQGLHGSLRLLIYLQLLRHF